MMDEEMLAYWAARGGVAASRLIDHGVFAACALETDADEEGSPRRLLSFTMGAFGQILIAELVADVLDGMEEKMRNQSATLHLSAGKGEIQA